MEDSDKTRLAQEVGSPTDALPEAESPDKVQAEQARQEKDTIRRCEEEYLGLLHNVAEIFHAVRSRQKTSEEDVQRVAGNVYALYLGYPPSLLLEKMQLTRTESDYILQHAINAALINALIAGLLCLPQEDIVRLIKIALVMDLGMLTLPAQISGRSGALSDEQRVRVRVHQTAAVRILKASGINDEKLLEAVIHHHERNNGTGYPKKLKGDEIPLFARITAFADSFDAAMAQRQYQKAKTLFQVMLEFSLNPNEFLDPRITKIATTGIADMLVGSYVVLSDRSIAK